MSHVVGVDAGGTSTRAIAVDADGTVLGTGRAGGGNPNSHPPAEAAARIAEAIALALGSLDPLRTDACVVGMAGVSKLSDPAIAEVFARSWAALGLGGEVHAVTDAEAAFASATVSPDGTVLVAGTGSIACRIRDRRLVSTSGGYGWLLGDEGSAYWIGREAVRATLAALSGHEPLDGLPAAVLAEAIGVHDPVGADERLAVSRRLITAVNGEPPIRLARFAPLVSEILDERSRAIVTSAADLLVENALATRDPGERTPIVLVGSVLGPGSPVGSLVRERLAAHEVLSSSDGVLGAARLAAARAWGKPDRIDTGTNTARRDSRKLG